MNGYNSSSDDTSSSNSYDPNEILELPIVQDIMFGQRREKRRPKIRLDRMKWHRHARILRDTGEFKTRYRMTYRTFKKLVDILDDITVHELQSVRLTSSNPPIVKEMIVGAAIRYFGGDPTSAVADMYGMAITSTKACINKFLETILDHPDLQIVAPTTEDELQTVADGFTAISTAPDALYKTCVGAIDGCLVTIHKPKDEEVDNPADY